MHVRSTALSFVWLALAVLWVCGPYPVRSTLVAYYSFDGIYLLLPSMFRDNSETVYVRRSYE